MALTRNRDAHPLTLMLHTYNRPIITALAPRAMALKTSDPYHADIRKCYFDGCGEQKLLRAHTANAGVIDDRHFCRARSEPSAQENTGRRRESNLRFPTASTISGNTSKLPTAPSTCLPAWFETTMNSQPTSSDFLASWTFWMPLRPKGRPFEMRFHSLISQGIFSHV